MNFLNNYILLLIVFLLARNTLAFNLPPGCLNAFRTSALMAHNILRNKHNSPSLIENADLDTSAQNSANRMASIGKLMPSTGENMYASYSNDPITVNFCFGKLEISFNFS